MHKSKIKQISLAVCLAFMPLSGFAAGLGKLNVNSGLGEPLKAEIELLSVTPEELSTLSAAIASEEAYAVQGITRLGIHSNIKVDLAKNTDGSPVLTLRSSLPISDPYLDMLVQVDWASGRLLREYTVLLDPPEYKQTVNAPPVPSTINKPAVASGSVSGDTSSIASDSAQKSTSAEKKSKKSGSKASKQQEAPVASSETNELTTQRGDTLNSIAKEMQIEGVSLDQMLVGLYESNKDAFVGGNMNRLKVGQIIKAPTQEVLASITPQQARQEVKVHSSNWNAYRNSLAGNVQAAPATEEAEQKQSASGKIASAEDKAAPVKSGPQDVVKLSAGDKVLAKDGKDSAKDFDAKILALQEEATAREKALKESQERTTALEKQIEDMQKLLALKSQAMTDLQKNAATTAAAPAAAPVVATPTPAPAVPTPAPAPAKEAKKAPVVAKAPAPVQPEPEPSFIDGLLDSANLTILGGLGGITLLGAGWMFLRNKRRKDLDSFERGILTSGGLRANTVFGNTTGNASTSDTSFLTDFAQSADGSMIDTNDVDPIAEAEVYMAYGRDAQAEEILKDAISKEPKRYELHLKLLEMYAARKDISAFEAIAGELYTTLGADDPTWAKVAELGATVEPDNPLYDVSKIAASTEAVAASQETADVAEVKPAAVDEGLDFPFDDELNEKAPSVQEDPNSVIMDSFSSANDTNQNEAFDLGSPDTGSSAVAAVSTDVTNAQLDDVVGDASAGGASMVESASDNSMDFDLSDFGVASAGTQDSGTVQELSNGPEFAPQDTAPTFDITSPPADVQPIELGTMTGLEEPKSDEIEFGLDFNFPDTTTEVAANEVQEVALKPDDFNFEGFETASTEPDAKAAEEITFDFPLSDEPVSDEGVPTSNPQDANAFDFSSISLDLGEEEAKASESQQSSDLPAAIMAENPDVDIKLDLVKAYIDMDDKEGARELLDEVVKEGGPQQRSRAEQLLTSLA